MTRANAISIPNQIRTYRRKRNLTLREVAFATGQADVSNVAHWEKGRKVPSLQNALKLSAIIQCPVEILFFGMFDSLREEIRQKGDRLSTKTKRI
jgi:transcriptional regulator with XRE-family HTH domain